ncbi:aldose 1-epimerase [Escherichia coli]|uniref:aldose epimerase family protein n=1 Tax=Escherichia coli TaxID=562 RepID=UPI001D40F255|nr:aldose 1-epimerase [Escherichia coli]ELO4979523.1 aldose 1-epimerase [Escherichia coli]MCG3933250.1 aldose 1-epimerase [Escherichia coli]HBB4262675.1 aldose 1-epimerase [Escherichia coli]HBI9734035.1 aldose 1-epimerase [Escherichia coli]HBI9750073.1 aldose 1-epimerase [Escherichia coli]
MTIYTLSHGSLKLDVSDQGGVIEGFWRDTTPLLRPGKKSGVATDASCFPLVPFGTGWHPYFPLSPQTRIQAQASGYWLEREQWLAGEFCEQLPQELDFNQLAPLPRQWVNNGFAGWNGQARIEQPQEGYAIIMETTPPAPCYFIFVSDPAFDKGYAFDFFCLEPMSHAPDDHHRPEGGDLIALAPGESTTSEMSLRVEWL